MKPWHLLVMVLLNIGWAGTIVINKALGTETEAAGGRAELPVGGDCNAAIRAGRAVHAGTVAALARVPLPRGRDFVMSVVIGLIVFVLGQRMQVLGTLLGTGRQLGHPDGGRTAAGLRGGRHFPAGTHRPAARGGLRPEPGRHGGLEPHLGAGLPLDRPAAEPDIHLLLRL
jgi:hypothetical protein